MSRSSSSNGRRRDDLAEYWFEKVASETKTVEEIRQHTLAENLSPVERTLAMLNSQSDIQRLVGIRFLSSVMISDRAETCRRLLPKFQSIIEQSVESEEHSVAAETIVSMLENRSLSYSEFMNLFSQMICTFIFPISAHRFSTDFGGIWCQALCNIIDHLPDTSSFSTLLDLIFDHSLHGSYVRDRLALILAKLSSRLDSQIVETRVLPVFKNFVNDTNAEIRALACQKLPIVAQALESSTNILPLLIILSKDENLFVRQSCFESLLDIADDLNDSKSIDDISEMLVSLVKFGLSSKTSKFITTIALRLADLCHRLNHFHLEEYQFIHELFLRLSQEKNHPDCRLACAKYFSAVIDYLGHEQMSHELEEVFHQFCRDNDWKVRAVMPLTIVELAKSAQDDEKNFASMIWNGFVTILNDNNQEVMINLSKNLSEIFKLFARDQSEGLLNGSICNLPAVSDSETFVTRLLDYERRIFETTLSWRSCIFCLQAFNLLPYLLSSEQIHTRILPRVYSRIFSKQVCVREVAVDSYIQLLRRVPRRSIRKNAFQKLKTDLLFNRSYQWRLMYLRACRQILVYYSKRFFKENFLETILSIEDDPVSSVRIQLVPLLIEIKSILRLPVDQRAIGKIETIMADFLAQKTYTLHDLANTGLLKLDQIRSYNPTQSIVSNDLDDQRKENEELFLDELDSSSRRPVSKSSDQTSLSKRLTDTSLTPKSSSLKSPRPSKSFSDEQTTELKINGTNKQRRRQTLNEGTKSSMRKISK